MVTKKGKGIVRFIGVVEFADGIMYGIELNEATGTHNGLIKGKQYFKCKPKHGVFTRLSSLKLIESAANIENRNDNDNASEFDVIDITSAEQLQINDRIMMKDKGIGYIRFIGKTHFSKNEIIYGIELNEALGLNNGTKDNKKYFECDELHGIFTRLINVKSKFISKRDNEIEFKMNDLVNVTKKCKGYIRYIGPLHFLSGTENVYGVELCEPLGTHNGTIKGQTYFECNQNYGIFCRKNQIKSIPIETLKKQFMNKHVKVKKKGHGYVRFIGNTNFAGDTIVIGVEMDEPIGNSNGSKNGATYFVCQDKHAIFTIQQNVSLLPTKPQCLHPETLISTITDDKLQQIMIQYINIGDNVLCYDLLSDQLITSTVVDKFKVNLTEIQSNKLIQLTICGDEKICIKCTENHYFYESSQQRYVMARELTVGDKLMFYNQQSETLLDSSISNIEFIENNTNNIKHVYDLCIENYHNYFANSILCHNMNPLPPVPSLQKNPLPPVPSENQAINIKEECEKCERIKISGTFYRYQLTEDEILQQIQHPTIVGKPKHKQYQLFIGLYQARRLLPSDETGLSDPYIIIHTNGKTFKSDIVNKRLNPVWMRGYLQNIILPDPINYAPPILLQVWDYDPSTIKTAYTKKENDFLGSCYISTENLIVEELNIIDPKPKWYSLYIMDKKDTSKQIKLQSEVLLSLQLISGHNQSIPSLNKSLLIFDQQMQKEKAEKITEIETEDEDEEKQEEKASELPKETPSDNKSKISKLLSPFSRKKKHENSENVESKKDKNIVAIKQPRKRKINNRFIDLTPIVEEVEVQIYVLGLRNINTSIGIINKPFITIHFPNGSNLATNPSNIPSKINPNFSQLFSVKMNLPKDSIFAPSIRVAVRDTLIGVGDIVSKFGKSAGKSAQRRLGWTFIELHDYLNNENEQNDGWIHPNEFKKRYMILKNKQKFENIDVDPVLSDPNLTEEQKQQYLNDKKQREMEQKTLKRLNKAMMFAKMKHNMKKEDIESDHDENRSYYGDSDDDDAYNFKSFMTNIIGNATEQNENNLAVYSDDDDNSFGWSTEDGYNESTDNKLTNIDEKQNENNMSWEDLIGLYRIPELRDRKIYQQQLEKELNLKPFIFNQIYSGKAKRRRHVADLKCLIRLKPVIEVAENIETEMDDSLSHLVTATDIMCRLYILRGIDLIPKESDQNSTCDPYFVVSLNNKHVINSRKQRKHNTCDPEFYETHEIAIKLPGDSTLKISIYDWNGNDVIGAVGGLVGVHSNDDLIGETVIDLENRWFSSAWHYLTDKPIERRDVLHPSSNHRQGQLEIILEILKLDSAKRIPLIDISPPPIEEWELRLIIWECRNVSSKDAITGLNDLYVSCSLISNEYIEEIGKQINNKSQKTDVHYRAKNGFGSFNWRMIWDIYLPCKQPPRLKIQLFDKDFGSDDSICECIFSLKELYKVGFIKKDTVTLYEDNNDKIWLDNLKHPNFIENQGEILISLQMMPKNIANEFPAGKGRDAPNQNPILFPPTGRIGFSLNPYKVISQIVGPSIMRKFKMYAVLCCLIGGFVMFAPIIAMTLFEKIINSLNPF